MFQNWTENFFFCYKMNKVFFVVFCRMWWRKMKTNLAFFICIYFCFWLYNLTIYWNLRQSVLQFYLLAFSNLFNTFSFHFLKKHIECKKLANKNIYSPMFLFFIFFFTYLYLNRLGKNNKYFFYLWTCRFTKHIKLHCLQVWLDRTYKG